jgi:hypothetical protein
MLIAALVIGLVTAYAYGPRAGVWAGGAALALFVLAVVVPGATLPVYAAVGVGVAATSSAAARRGPHVKAQRAVKLARVAWERLRGKRP